MNVRPAHIAVLALAVAANNASAQEAATFEPTIHWAYASFFGTGWYRITDEQSGFIVRAPFRWTKGEAGIDEDGRRHIAYRLRLPFTLGVSRLDFGDIPDVIDLDNLATVSANVSVDADIPLTRRIHIRPVAEVGYSSVIGDKDEAWTYRAELKSRTAFAIGKLDWNVLLDVGIVGYEPNRGRADDFEFAKAAFEFGYPVDWLRAGGGQTMLYWSLGYTAFLDEIEVQRSLTEVDTTASVWQAGIAVGKRDEPLRLWRFKFDRLGLAYNYSTTGGLRGIKFIFRSLYDL